MSWQSIFGIFLFFRAATGFTYLSTAKGAAAGAAAEGAGEARSSVLEVLDLLDTKEPRKERQRKEREVDRAAAEGRTVPSTSKSVSVLELEVDATASTKVLSSPPLPTEVPTTNSMASLFDSFGRRSGPPRQSSGTSLGGTSFITVLNNVLHGGGRASAGGGPDDHPEGGLAKVFYTEGGSNAVWQQIVAGIGRERIRTGQEVAKLTREGTGGETPKWRVWIAGGNGGGRSEGEQEERPSDHSRSSAAQALNGNTLTKQTNDLGLADEHFLSKSEDFDQIIVALHGDDASRLLRSAGRSDLFSRQIGYTTEDIILHTHLALLKDSAPYYDPTSGVATSTPGSPEDIVYHVYPNHMSGLIGHVFRNFDRKHILTMTRLGEAGVANQIPGRKVLSKWRWKHPEISLWSVAFSRFFLHALQGRENLWLAGDWVRGIGHEDAINSGLYAACASGLPRQGLDEEALRRAGAGAGTNGKEAALRKLYAQFRAWCEQEGVEEGEALASRTMGAFWATVVFSVLVYVSAGGLQWFCGRRAEQKGGTGGGSGGDAAGAETGDGDGDGST